MEVKELPSQTGKAIGEIGVQIAAIQDLTQQSMNGIQNVARTIAEISRIPAPPAAAKEERGAAASEVFRNIQLAPEQVMETVVLLHQGAGKMRSAAGQFVDMAREHSHQTSMLGQEVCAFMSVIRAA